jgi:ABC-type multidrug transport system fused ATPase/permease subunit
MLTAPAKIDPIRKKFFGPLELAETSSDVLFGLSFILSIVVWLIDEKTSPRLNSLVQIAFLIAVLASFALGHVIRVYLLPRALDSRLRDFLSTAFGVPLSHVQTVSYYNNNQTESMRKLAAQVFENSLFSKEIASRMAITNRITTSVYVALFFAAVWYRSSTLGFLVILAQAVFSEQIISRFIRMEWMRMRFEKSYADMYRLFQSKPAATEFNAMALESFSGYEAAKALGGITLSSKLFEEINPEITKEWDQVKIALGI